jgi:hypothetical protein
MIFFCTAFIITPRARRPVSEAFGASPEVIIIPLARRQMFRLFEAFGVSPELCRSWNASLLSSGLATSFEFFFFISIKTYFNQLGLPR